MARQPSTDGPARAVGGRWLIGALAVCVLALASAFAFIYAARALPPGDWLAFTSDWRGRKDLHLLDVTRRVRLQLTETPNISEERPTWAPDGSVLAYQAYTDGGMFPHLCFLALPDIVTRCLPRQGEWDDRPAWSPDGSAVTIETNLNNDVVESNWEILTLDVALGEVRNLTAHPANDYGAVWSPDGERIAFVSERLGWARVFVMNRDGSDPQPLVPDPPNPALDQITPIWSPDGAQIAFVVPLGYARKIYISAVGSGQMQPLRPDPAYEAFPAWSPDGEWIAFLSDHAGGDQDIFVISARGQAPARALTDNDMLDTLPIWSPDGSRIVFLSNRAGGSDLYLLWLNENGLPEADRLTFGDGEYDTPVWRPQG